MPRSDLSTTPPQGNFAADFGWKQNALNVVVTRTWALSLLVLCLQACLRVYALNFWHVCSNYCFIEIWSQFFKVRSCIRCLGYGVRKSVWIDVERRLIQLSLLLLDGFLHGLPQGTEVEITRRLVGFQCSGKFTFKRLIDSRTYFLPSVLLLTWIWSSFDPVRFALCALLPSWNLQIWKLAMADGLKAV